jgi:hypothetical protein
MKKIGMPMSTPAPKMATKLPGQSRTTLPNFGFAKHWLKNQDIVSSGYSQGLFYQNKRRNNDVNQSSTNSY